MSDETKAQAEEQLEHVQSEENKIANNIARAIARKIDMTLEQSMLVIDIIDEYLTSKRESSSIKQADEMSLAFNEEINALQERHKAERESASKREAELQWNLVKRNERIVEREDALVLSISLQKALQKALVERDSQIAELTKRQVELLEACRRADQALENAYGVIGPNTPSSMVMEDMRQIKRAIAKAEDRS